MLSAYFDVSGHVNDDARAFAVAGFAAPVSEWEQFNAAWPGVLRGAGIPELHMTYVASKRKDGFRELTADGYRGLMLEVHDLLKRHASKSFARIIEGDDLEAIRNSGGSPIAIAGAAAIQAVAAWRDKRNNRRSRCDALSAVVFDHGEKGKGQLLKAAPTCAPRPEFQHSLKVPALQAADWLAWELARLNQRHKENRADGTPRLTPVKVRGTVWHAIRHFPRDWKVYRKGEWMNVVHPDSERIRRAL